MPNNITYFKIYIDMLDHVYKQASKTSILDGAADVAQAGSNANEIVIPKISMDGLGDYSRNGGYVAGDVTLTNETVKCNFDRGRKFTVDAMDDVETAGVAFGRLSSEFIRTKVVPELDAFRFAKYASLAGDKVAADITTGENAVAALSKVSTTMDDAEVPMESRHLFITSPIKALIDDMDTTKSRACVARFASVTVVPQTRFYSAIDQKDGKTLGEEGGGFAKSESAKDINFMVVEKSAAIQYQKHTVSKIIDPDTNQDADGWMFAYRDYGICDAYENKVAGIALHTKA